MHNDNYAVDWTFYLDVSLLVLLFYVQYVESEMSITWFTLWNVNWNKQQKIFTNQNELCNIVKILHKFCRVWRWCIKCRNIKSCKLVLIHKQKVTIQSLTLTVYPHPIFNLTFWEACIFQNLLLRGLHTLNRINIKN